jgi:DNA invertase Pin-like site-specific DNA recombinase
MTSMNKQLTIKDIWPEALSVERKFLADGGVSRQPCVFYLRKSIGDDFATQVLRCVQHARNSNLRLDVSLGIEGVYYDEDKSGSKNIERPGYNDLMADIMSGKLAGRFVIVRDQDRLSRRESSVLEDYHVITSKSKVQTFESSGREIRDDVTTGIMGVIARNESKIIGHRMSAKKEERAIAGAPPASRVRRIGYTKGLNSIHWEEAKMLRRARSKVAAGQSLGSVVKQLYEAGARKESGKPYIVSDLSRLLRDPVYAALRTFTRDIELEGKIIPKGEPIAKGVWPPIFTVEEHQEVVRILSKNKAWATSRTPKHLLVGILVCAECGTKMAYGSKTGNPRKDGTKKRHYVYKCPKERGGCAKVSRNSAALENFFLKLTYEAIKRLPVVEERVVDTSPGEIARQERKIADAVDAFKNDRIDIATLADIRQDAQRKIDGLRKSRAAEAQPLPLNDAESFRRSEDVNKQRDTIRRFFPAVGVKGVTPGVRFHPDQLVFPKTVLLTANKQS